jgi:hypothetical protein
MPCRLQPPRALPRRPQGSGWAGTLTGGVTALADASSRPERSPGAIDSAKALLILELRRRRMLQSRIARSVGVSESKVNRVLARAGLSRLSDLEPVEPLVRYEHEAPDDLLHIDTKKLGRIERPSHRVTGSPRLQNQISKQPLDGSQPGQGRIGSNSQGPERRTAARSGSAIGGGCNSFVVWINMFKKQI